MANGLERGSSADAGGTFSLSSSASCLSSCSRLPLPVVAVAGVMAKRVERGNDEAAGTAGRGLAVKTQIRRQRTRRRMQM